MTVWLPARDAIESAELTGVVDEQADSREEAVCVADLTEERDTDDVIEEVEDTVAFDVDENESFGVIDEDVVVVGRIDFDPVARLDTVLPRPPPPPALPSLLEAGVSFDEGETVEVRDGVDVIEGDFEATEGEADLLPRGDADTDVDAEVVREAMKVREKTLALDVREALTDEDARDDAEDFNEVVLLCVGVAVVDDVFDVFVDREPIEVVVEEGEIFALRLMEGLFVYEGVDV